MFRTIGHGCLVVGSKVVNGPVTDAEILRRLGWNFWVTICSRFKHLEKTNSSLHTDQRGSTLDPITPASTSGGDH